MIYPLLSQEHENHLMLVPSITTLTFYKLREGESAEEEEEEEDLGLDKDHCQDLLDNLTGFPNHIANHLSTKCSEILAANPWLSGRIVRNGLDKKQQQQQLVLVVEDCEEEEGQHLLKKHLSFVSRSLAGFSSSSPYHIANERAQSLFPDALVPPARHLIDDPHHRPLFKITAIHLREANEILLITSLCHAVADGFTFYAINSMLDKNGEVYPMDPVRRPELEVQYRQQFPDMVPRVISRFPARFIFSTLVNIVQVRAYLSVEGDGGTYESFTQLTTHIL